MEKKIKDWDWVDISLLALCVVIAVVDVVLNIV